MAKYKAIQKGHDGKKIREIGDEFEYSGTPGAWMEPVDEEAKKASEVKKAPEAKSKAKAGHAKDGESTKAEK